MSAPANDNGASQVRGSGAFARLRQAWRNYRAWVVTSPEKLILNALTLGAIYGSLILSVDYLNAPMRLSEMSVYEGDLVNFSPSRKSSCGGEIEVRLVDGSIKSFRGIRIYSQESKDYLRGEGKGKPIKVWARDRYYNPYCFSVPPYAHQIAAGDRMIDEYSDEQYLRWRNTHENLNKWWVGVPAFIGLLGLFGLWRIDRRDRRLTSSSKN